jgi:2-dehydropantoate 2-reductase
MQIKTASIMGLGSIGSIAALAALKALGDSNVKIIAGGERGKKLKENGLTINGEKYYFNISSPYEKSPADDLVIVAVKAYSLNEAIKDIKEHVGPHTTIISLMNGITSEEDIGAVYGDEKLIYSTININSRRDDNGICYSAKSGAIKIGERDGNTKSDRLLAVRDMFLKGGVQCDISSTIIRDLWHKLLMNASCNSVETILRGNHGYFHKIKEANDAIKMIMKEVIAVSKAAGTGLEDKDLEKLDGFMNKFPAEGLCSTVQDLNAGRRMEIEALIGVIVDMGKKYGVPTPVCEFAYYILYTLNAVNTGALK